MSKNVYSLKTSLAIKTQRTYNKSKETQNPNTKRHGKRKGEKLKQD